MIRIGTSGYSFDDWIGNFYPPGIRKGDMLSHYAKHFKVVEVNSSYYRIPHPAVFYQMEKKTGPDFEFFVKANKAMTHEGSTTPALYEKFMDSCRPLIEAGKFRGILAQFAWGFKHSAKNLEHLRKMRDNFKDTPLVVEFRNDSWMKDEVFSFLEQERISFCAVDEPNLRGLMPPVVKFTAEPGYVRFHGRNAKNWWGRSGGDRYDYDYNEKELEEWLGKIGELAEKARKTYLFFNNCHAGQAARSAKLMERLLSLES
ncbi:MAG: hypothetical protein AMJ46_02930 [Latescibacteria bacterium DG_63]|nr:MAG: hypothetical protein AMJ46_02930 [Latescibacteria bacterium DG_63]